MEFKITPEDLVPDFNRKMLECTANLIAHTASGATEAAEAWRRAAEAMVEVGKACERINAKLATVTPQSVTVDYAAPIAPKKVHASGWQWRPVTEDTAFAPPFGTIRACRCGCLVAGGLTVCGGCAQQDGR